MQFECSLQVEDVVDYVLDDLQLGQFAILGYSRNELLELGQQRLHFFAFQGASSLLGWGQDLACLILVCTVGGGQHRVHGVGSHYHLGGSRFGHDCGKWISRMDQ